jgi:hypothetical protein
MSEEGGFAEGFGKAFDGTLGVAHGVFVAKADRVFAWRPTLVMLPPGGNGGFDPSEIGDGLTGSDLADGAIPRPLRGKNGEGISHDMEEGAVGVDPVGEAGLENTEIFERGESPVGFQDGTL